MAGACAGRTAERLAVAPVPPTSTASSAGPPGALEPLGLGGERDGVLMLPPGADPAPLILMLHGASGTGRRAARLILGPAEERGCVVLAPDSRGASWDAITGAFGPDVRFLERALGAALGRRAVDRTRIAVAGFSDGATYALALGRANGGLFTHLIAFSPGFLLPDSHGRRAADLRVPRPRRIGFCRSTPAADAWCPGSGTRATTCATGSSTGITRCRKRWRGKPWTGSSPPRPDTLRS